MQNKFSKYIGASIILAIIVLVVVTFFGKLNSMNFNGASSSEASKIQSNEQRCKLKYHPSPKEMMDCIRVDKKFKSEQLKNINAAKAYQQKEAKMKKLLAEKNIDYQTLEVYIRVIKQEELVELWAKDRTINQEFQFIKSYKLCLTNNHDGLRGIDLLIPESFYTVVEFLPYDPYYARLLTDFPTACEKLRGRTGGGIALHGGCFSTYCSPLTDEDIKEVYIMAVEARSKGQWNVPIHNFPARLNDSIFNTLKANPKYNKDEKLIALWKNLKPMYDYFELKRKLLKYTHNDKGEYIFSEE